MSGRNKKLNTCKSLQTELHLNSEQKGIESFSRKFDSLQNQINVVCNNDKSHTKELSQNV